MYSIPHLQVAVANLRKQLEQLEKQLDDIPVSTTRPDRVRVSGGERVSIQDRWLLKRETIEDQREWLKLLLLEKQAALDLFASTLEQLRQEDNLAAELLELRYIKKFGSMEKIAEHLFCSRTHLYEVRKQAIKYFFLVLPWLFIKPKERQKTGHLNRTQQTRGCELYG
ncbi:MAG: hypothetical protein ACOYCB_13025 [Fastidiosipilaceae bacterium]